MSFFVAGPGKHLFQAIRSPQLRVETSGDPDAPPPDLVVIPCQTPDSLDAWSEELPPAVRGRIRQGQASVVFDGSGEAIPHSPEMTRAIHGLLERLGADVARACHVTQNRTYQADYHAYCAAHGLRRRMRILVYDFWIKWFFAPYEKAAGQAAFERRLQAFRARPSRRPRRFVSLNWSLRANKAFFVARLLRDGLWQEGFVSSGGVERLPGGLPRLSKRMRETPGFGDLHEALEPYLPRLQAMGPVRLGGLAADPNAAHLVADDPDLGAYDRSWFSAVTESEMWDRPARISEKPFKPLVNFHPLVVFGNPGALAMIRELGFETFAEVIDESYDEEADPRRRFEMAYAEFARLARQDEAELARMERRIAGKLEFNARFGLTRLPAVFRKRIDLELIRELAALAAPA